MKRRHRISVLLLILLAASASVSAAQAAEWGSLKGRFVYDGDAPTPLKLNVNKDVAVCSKHAPVDESLVVGSDGGLGNVLIYVRSKKKLDVHPDYQQEADAKVSLDNKGCRFEPHIALMRTSQTLEIKNSDPVGHNTKADCVKNTSFNILIPSGETLDRKLTREETVPIKVGCNIHPWMTGFVLVRNSPYMAITGEDGSFEIKNIPAGKHEFQLWQEKSGYLRGIEVGGKKTSKKGRIKLDIEAGETKDLGDILIDPDVLSGS